MVFALACDRQRFLACLGREGSSKQALKPVKEKKYKQDKKDKHKHKKDKRWGCGATCTDASGRVRAGPYRPNKRSRTARRGHLLLRPGGHGQLGHCQ